MKFPLIKDTKLLLGNQVVTYVGEGAVEMAGVETPDQLAEHLAAAGQKIYGQYVNELAHEETVTRRDGVTGEDYRVQVRVTYVAGGARHEQEISAREPVAAPSLPPPPPAPVPIPAPAEAPAPVAEAGGEISSETEPQGTVVAPVEGAATTEVAAQPAETVAVATGPGGIERREKVRRLINVGPPPEGERRVAIRRAEDQTLPQA